MSWKTTIIGLVLVLLGVGGVGFSGLDKVTGTAIITAGLGLVVAKDHNQS